MSGLESLSRPLVLCGISWQNGFISNPDGRRETVVGMTAGSNLNTWASCSWGKLPMHCWLITPDRLAPYAQTRSRDREISFFLFRRSSRMDSMTGEGALLTHGARSKTNPEALAKVSL